MTKEELLLELRYLAEPPESNIYGIDVERIHVRADKLLLRYIDDHEITAAFDEIHKWYA